MVVCCEVCGSSSGRAPFLLCGACKPEKQAGCHTCCMPGFQLSLTSTRCPFTCKACRQGCHARRRPAACSRQVSTQNCAAKAVTRRAACKCMAALAAPAPAAGSHTGSTECVEAPVSVSDTVALTQAQPELLTAEGAVALTDLQHLSFSSAPADTFSQVPKLQLNQSLPDSFMARFGQLTKLTGMCLPAATAADQQLWSGPGSQHMTHLMLLHHLSRAVALQRYTKPQRLFPEPARSLHYLTALTQLHLSGCSGSIIPSLGALSALRRLVLHECSALFGPGMLAGLRGLVHLELPAQTPWNAEEHSHALPSILQEQKQLALPRLNCSLETADGPDHTALVASSKTQTLHTSGPNAPVNTWQYVCQLGQLLQQLTSLQLDVTCTVRPMSPGKLHKLADACSALQQLSLHPEPAPEDLSESARHGAATHHVHTGLTA